ncbi:DUF6115 domain-containing protein [Butyrivibrio sp. YAB3001]|uniref:DUF6115 domain-containing protein n=1 Tax=Butyrivibrio sp. YAB3001 TaxID=1520812 RepID=UPI0008F646AE|nr:DUF6115 domain-containing protein [Butyrivibrio sp. YAB3001]SFB66962.1 hypothetical protein SAMN02910398_00083 [Butyrivibrio sp. YAB3001]
MISITEIVLIVAGFAAIVLGYLLPANKEVNDTDKKFMEREIRELVRREVEDQKETIENMVDDTVDNTLDRTERAMERISNEKLSAINEYSDTVINDITKNHNEVMFMYDMLNDKHKNLNSVVSEVAKKTNEAKQVVRDAEATVRDAEATARDAEAAARDAVTTAREAQAATSNLASSAALSHREKNVRAILLDEETDTLSGIRIPYMEKDKPAAPKETPKANQVAKKSAQTQNVSSDAPRPVRRKDSGYIERNDVKELNDIHAEVIPSDQLSSLHVIGSKSENNTSAKVVQLTDAMRADSKSYNPDKNMHELTANDPATQNRRIIEMHKAGKSNMVIARELGMGIGEVKLVIDLSDKHRKVR